MDKVDGDGLTTTSMFGGKYAIVLEVDNVGVAVVGGEIVGGQEIGPQYSRLNIGYHKLEFECLVSNLNRSGAGSEAVDVRAIGRLQLGLVGTVKALLGGGGDYGEKSSPIHQPFFVASSVCDVEEVAVSRVRASNIVDAIQWLALAFPDSNLL